MSSRCCKLSNFFPLDFFFEPVLIKVMTQFLGFDPLKFLDIANLNNQEKDTVSKNLLDKISQYILIRISELLPTEDVKKAVNPEDIFSLAQAQIPDLNDKMKLFLADFKKEFYKNIKI